MSITDPTKTKDAGGQSQGTHRAKKPYMRPTVHIDDIPGPVLCASQGQGGGTTPVNPNCPPWNPNC